MIVIRNRQGVWKTKSNQSKLIIMKFRCAACTYKQSEGKGKGKAIPVRACIGLEGYNMLRLPDFMTIGTW
jgi:hypothetical protein